MIKEDGRLTFLEESHQYFLDGVEIPSVSKILKPLSEKSYGSIPPAILQTAADRGSAVHFAIEAYLLFGENLAEDIAIPYMSGFMDWISGHNVTVLDVEKKIHHPTMQYGGTLDLLANIDGRLTLVDYKTSSKVLEKIYRVQLEAYSQMLKEQGILIERKLILHLRKDLPAEVIEFPAKDAVAWKVFGALKTIYDWGKV